MSRTRILAVGGGVLAAVLVLGGGAYAVDRATDDDLRGDALTRASESALAETGGGRVASAETSDDLDHRYEVEVRTEDGREVDVLLDESFEVVATEGDEVARTTGGAAPGSSAGGSGATADAGTSDRGTTDRGTTDQGTTDRGTTDRVTDAEHAAAAEAALAETGGGRVTDVERSDDADHVFEVEVLLEDGTEVDVDLDAAFAVVRTTTDR